MLVNLAIPLQLVCQLVTPGNSESGNSTFATTITFTEPIESPQSPDLYQAFPVIGIAYKFYNERVTWTSAHKACVEKNSNLAVVDSFEKYEYIMDMIQKRKGPGPHVGIYRTGNSEWISATTGLPPAGIPWAPLTWVGNPANQCLAMWNDRTGVGADQCHLLRPYVCEIPLFRDRK